MYMYYTHTLTHTHSLKHLEVSQISDTTNAEADALKLCYAILK